MNADKVNISAMKNVRFNINETIIVIGKDDENITKGVLRRDLFLLIMVNLMDLKWFLSLLIVISIRRLIPRFNEIVPQVLSIGLLISGASLAFFFWEHLVGKEESVTPWREWHVKF